MLPGARVGRFGYTHKHTHSQSSAQTDAATQALLRFIGVSDQGERKLEHSLSARGPSASSAQGNKHSPGEEREAQGVRTYDQ